MWYFAQIWHFKISAELIFDICKTRFVWAPKKKVFNIWATISWWSGVTKSSWSSFNYSRPSFLKKSAMVWYQTCGAWFNLYKALCKRPTSLGQILNWWSCSVYMTSSRNLYKKIVTKSNCRIWSTLHSNSQWIIVWYKRYNSWKSFHKVNIIFLLKAVIDSFGFVFQNLTISVFFQLKTPLKSNQPLIFQHSCEFPGLIFGKKVIFSLNSFFPLRLIKTTYCLFNCVRFVISFVI